MTFLFLFPYRCHFLTCYFWEFLILYFSLLIEEHASKALSIMTLAFWKSSSFKRRKYSFTLYVWFLDLFKSHSIGWIWINNDFIYHSSFCLQGNISGWQILENDVSSRYSCPLMPSGLTIGKFSTGDIIWKTVLLDFPFWVLKIHISHSISDRGICFEDMLKRTKCILSSILSSV